MIFEYVNFHGLLLPFFHSHVLDYKALLLSHPHTLTRDTQVLAGRHGTISTNDPPAESSNGTHPPAPVKRNKRQALRRLVSQELGINIQLGEHSSVGD